VVRAIQTLYSTVNTAWAKQFDWQYWMDAAQTLEPEHVSTARDAPAPTPVRLAERVADTRLAPIVHAHPQLFEAFSNTVAARGLAITTEKTYLAWTCRFIAYLESKPPESASEADVQEFLSGLVTQRNVAASTQSQALNALVFFSDMYYSGHLGNSRQLNGLNALSVFPLCSPIKRSKRC